MLLDISLTYSDFEKSSILFLLRSFLVSSSSQHCLVPCVGPDKECGGVLRDGTQGGEMGGKKERDVPVPFVPLQSLRNPS